MMFGWKRSPQNDEGILYAGLPGAIGVAATSFSSCFFYRHMGRFNGVRRYLEMFPNCGIVQNAL
jgi:hypothetical protein